MFDRSSATLANVDPEIWAAVQAENRRQEDHIELIASENYTSPAVMAAQGSQLTNKYAEGYPGRRYYGGCEFVDVVEQLAIDRLKQLFGAGHANVQANSGSQANQSVFFGLLPPVDMRVPLGCGRPQPTGWRAHDPHKARMSACPAPNSCHRGAMASCATAAASTQHP